MEIVLLIFLLVLSLFNSIVIIGICIFLVQFRDRMNNMFLDLFTLFEVMDSLPPVVLKETNEDQLKTWDEKYEKDLEIVAKRLSSDSGLKDLSSPKLSWGEPPAPQNIEGLIIKNK